MLLSEPQKTGYDLNFNFLGFPVRVHPAFVILPILLGSGFINSDEMNFALGLALIVIVFFVSILVHELGHALAFKWCGVPSRIVLYWMGGLAIPDRNSWKSGRKNSLTPNEQIFVSFAGPLAGLLLAGVFVGVVYATGCSVTWYFLGPIPLPNIKFVEYLYELPTLATVILAMIYLNILLNLFNLVPVFPLDGGQIARQFFLKFDPWGGLRNSLFISIAFAIFLAIIGLKFGHTFLAFFFGYMAYSNFQMLQYSGQNRMR